MQLVCGALVEVYLVIFTKMADKFETLEEQLERFIENTRQMGIIVSDFQPQGQNALNQKLYVFMAKDCVFFAFSCRRCCSKIIM